MIPMNAANAALSGASQATSLGTSYAINALTPEGQAMAAQNRDDIARLKRNNFGPSQAEQERAVMDAAAQVRAASAGALAEAQRAKAAQSYRGPDTATAQIVKQNAQQVGQLRMQASDNAAQLARQAKLDALGRVKALSDKTVSDIQSIRDEGHKAYMGTESGQDVGSAYGITGKKANKDAYGAQGM